MQLFEGDDDLAKGLLAAQRATKRENALNGLFAFIGGALGYFLTTKIRDYTTGMIIVIPGVFAFLGYGFWSGVKKIYDLLFHRRTPGY